MQRPPFNNGQMPPGGFPNQQMPPRPFFGGPPAPGYGHPPPGYGTPGPQQPGNFQGGNCFMPAATIRKISNTTPPRFDQPFQ